MDAEVKIENVQIKEEMVDLDEEFVVDNTLRDSVKTEITEPTNTMSPNSYELMNTETDAGTGEHVCNKCGNSYTNESELYNHITRECEKESQSGEKKCPFCSFSTEFMDDMTSHVTLKHRVSLDPLATEFPTEERTKLKQFRCLICSKEMLHKKDLEQHLLTEHNELNEDRPVCKPCGKSFTTRKNLRNHIKYCDKTNSDVKKFKCPYCPHETKYKKSLPNHIKVLHSDGETGPHVCKSCGNTYTYRRYLMSHVKFCRKKNHETLKFKCSHCPHETLHKSSLRRHITFQHPIDPIERPICEGCRKSFASAEILRQHMKYCEQTNIAPIRFKCSHCSHETKRKWDLPEHIARVHFNSPIGRPICSKCGKSFKNIYALKNHSRKYCEKTTTTKC